LTVPGVHGLLGDPALRAAMEALKAVTATVQLRDQMVEQYAQKEMIPSSRPATLMAVPWIVLGMTGARGDPVQGHVVGAIKYVQEPKTDHIMADKNAQDGQTPPHHATQMIAQLIVLGALGVHGHHVQRHVAGAHRAVQEPKMDQSMAEKNAQDPQVLPDHATLIAAQHVHVIRQARAALGVMVAMKSAVMGEEAMTAKKEKPTVTRTLTVRAL